MPPIIQIVELPKLAADLTAETPPEKIPPTVRKIPPTAFDTPEKMPDATLVTPPKTLPTAPEIDRPTEPSPTAFVIDGRALNKNAMVLYVFAFYLQCIIFFLHVRGDYSRLLLLVHLLGEHDGIVIVNAHDGTTDQHC